MYSIIKQIATYVIIVKGLPKQADLYLLESIINRFENRGGIIGATKG